LRQAGQSLAQNFIEGITAGGNGLQGSQFFRQLTPNSQAIGTGLDKTRQLIPSEARQGLRPEDVQLSDRLQGVLQKIDAVPSQAQFRNDRPLPTLALPRQLPNIEAVRVQTLEQQSRANAARSAEITRNVIESYNQAFASFGGITAGSGAGRLSGDRGGGTATAAPKPKIEAPITVNINVPIGSAANEIGEQVDRRLRSVVNKANQMYITE